MDEAGKQLLGEVRLPLPARAGRLAREDSMYLRHGTANQFLTHKPLDGRHVEATERRTAADFARFLRRLLYDLHHDAAKMVLVSDHLNTHGVGSVSKAFAPAEAGRPLERHFTPKHGSWRDVAEVELSVLSRQCLSRRVPDAATLAAKVGA